MTNWTERGIEKIQNLSNFTGNLLSPTIKLGVTGLSKAGKTVFITSLIHHLLNPARLSFFEPIVAGRISRIYLEPHPNDLIPRFDYEGHLAKLLNNTPSWPASTKELSQLRLTIEYRSDHFIARKLGPSKLHIDIIDYPGEWLLDLALLEITYEEWCDHIFTQIDKSQSLPTVAAWLELVKTCAPDEPLDEGRAKKLAASFKAALIDIRKNNPLTPLLTPGRFLMPGDLANSPALNFSPVHLGNAKLAENSMAALMRRRFESYKSQIVRPFYKTTFTRIDRQIVLVDVLTCLNGGTSALKNLQTTLTRILDNFNPGANNWLSSIWNKRIDRIVFAATKADHLHHHQHDKLQTIMSYLTQAAINNAAEKGAEIKVQALASLRATTEIEIEEDGQIFEALRGTPSAGEQIDGKKFDGKTEAIIFPGDLPGDCTALLDEQTEFKKIEIVKFQPPTVDKTDMTTLPHIRLDRALNMAFGDKLA